tara:strand:- start:183 stop:686 length:504 start_codon:yes stop_codon:yes gene_type:complete
MVTYEDVAEVIEYSEEKGYVPESTAKALLEAIKIGKEQGATTHYTPEYVLLGPFNLLWQTDLLAKDINEKIDAFTESIREDGQQVEGGFLPGQFVNVEPIVYPAIRVLLTIIESPYGRLQVPESIVQKFRGFLGGLQQHENRMVDFREENKSYNKEKPSWWNIVKTF